MSWGTGAKAEPEVDVRALGSPNGQVKEMMENEDEARGRGEA